MINVAFIGYREWGYEIYKELVKELSGKFKFDLVITSPTSEFTNEIGTKNYHIVEGNDNKKIYQLLKDNRIDIAICYSWSWIIREPILSEFICLCLHPSPLPKFRGGTPIQHQILSGVNESAVSIFRMSEGIDDGPLYSQTPISYLGDIGDIFQRMVDVGISETKKLLKDFENGDLKFKPQKDLGKYPPMKRRKPAQSQITTGEISDMTFLELNNFVRALTGPYPHAFIKLANGNIFLLKVTESKNPDGVCITDEMVFEAKEDEELHLKLGNTFAVVEKYYFEPS